MNGANHNQTPQRSASQKGPGAVPGRSGIPQKCGFPEPTMVGSSDAFSSLLDTLKSIAGRHCSVMITGETGTGKEMVARNIHYYSKRPTKPFIPVDCTTLTGSLFESQLFGHVKGAFTGAIHDTLGFFRAANGGTIFLDEISEIPLELQAKLLRVLQEGTVTPVGSTISYPVDVRVLCASNRDLRHMVDKNEFRADLFYRINVVKLEIPPLRQRSQDILPLANYFVRKLAEFYDELPKTLAGRTQEFLLKYHWPGNVREIANVMERAFVLSQTDVIEPAALPAEILMSEYAVRLDCALPTLDAAEHKLVSEALRVTNGKKIAAAKILGIDRRRLNRLIERLHIQVPKD